MSSLSLVLLRFGYLALLWIFILGTVLVVRSDMFGTKIARQPHARKPAAAKPPKPVAKTSKPRRGDPTHVAIIDGSGAGRSIALTSPQLLIGRGADAAIRLEDDYASTRHARIIRSGDQWFVEDLGSTNGTYLGTRRLTQPTVISTGSQIRIGKTVLELRK